MRIEKCWFCSSNVYPGHGICFVRNDAKMFRFCRSKCHKHFKAKHNPRKCKWTKAFRKSAGKEMTLDSTFEFERRRNTPVRYDRNLFVKTVRAMKSIDRIKAVRKERFYKQRLLAVKDKNKTLAQKELKRNDTLITGPNIPQKNRMVMEDEEKKELVAMEEEDGDEVRMEDPEEALPLLRRKQQAKKSKTTKGKTTKTSKAAITQKKTTTNA
eukprot:GHVS01068349.1.p1 GENE.GHVS01068349.1~~GHVS01068349.1.p1  ORF type:complete len:212 (+),score=42.43 GHVS01068349.1:75-710(+)